MHSHVKKIEFVLSFITLNFWTYIELFVALFALSLCPFNISVGVGAFVIGLGQISSFFSHCKQSDNTYIDKEAINIMQMIMSSYFLRFQAQKLTKLWLILNLYLAHA